MPDKRRVLEQLKRSELLAALDRFELQVQNRRVRSEIVNVLVRSRKATLAGILDALSEDQLQAICRALELDADGPQETLLSRLLGSSFRRDAPARSKRRTESFPLTPKAKSSDLDEDSSKVSTSPISIGRFSATRCGGVTQQPELAHKAHNKPFLGIADIAEMRYCEIQSTISQIRCQKDYSLAAVQDDLTGGIERRNPVPRDAKAERLAAKRAADLAALPAQDWETRRTYGRLIDQAETASMPSERRHWDLGEFMVIGIPDGIDGSVLVEVGASRRPELIIQTKMIQANIYAVLWQLPSYRAIAIDAGRGARHVKQMDSDVLAAERVIARAWDIFSGRLAPTPPNPSKCRPCRERGACPYPSSGRIPTLDDMRRAAALKEG
jgi:hypothetical protein